MGARTRSFANLLNTDGTFLSGAINNTSVSGITDLPTAAKSDLVLISSATASDDQYVSFTSGIDSTYSTYVVQVVNAKGTSGTPRMMFQGSTNSGSSYGVTATTTMFQAYHNEADTSTGLLYETGTDEAQSTSNLFLAGDIDTGESDSSTSFDLWLFNPSNTTYVKHFLHRSSSMGNGNYAVQHFKGGYFNTTSAINALRFATSSGGGNIATGSFYLYGLK